MSIHIAVASPLLVQFDCLSFMLVRRSSFSIVWRLAVVQAILTMQHALHINGATQQRKRLIGGESLYRVCIQARFCAAMRSLADVVYFMLTRRLAFIICKLAVNLHAGEPEYTHKFNLYVK
eukprot:scaffold25469_cov77-Cyclotella_meneghiniana.AAC.8